MLVKTKSTQQTSLFLKLEDQLSQQNPIYKLANKIDWNTFEQNFHDLYCHNNERPAKPIRRMVGLLILKHLRNLSDELVVEQWSENAYTPDFGSLRRHRNIFEFRENSSPQGARFRAAESISSSSKHTLLLSDDNKICLWGRWLNFSIMVNAACNNHHSLCGCKGEHY